MRIYKSGDIQVPQDVNLTELLHSSARSDLPGDHQIANDCLTGRKITIEGLRDRAGRLAKGLKDQLNPIDQSRWAVILPNSVNYVEVFHAILWLGGVGCPINHALKPAEIAHALITSKPQFIIAYGAVVSQVLEARSLALKRAKDARLEFAEPRIITVLAEEKTYPDIEDFLASQRLPVPQHSNTKSRLASIHLSSGTTGSPKGVALSHFNYVANVLQLFKDDPDHWNPDVRIVAYTPFVHIANTTIPLFLGPWTGMLHCIMPSYNLETLAKMVVENKANTIQAVSSVSLAIANTDVTERYDFSSVQHLITGQLSMNAETYERLLKKGNWKSILLYGMTEAAPYVVFQRLDQELPLHKIGNLLPGIEARLVTEDGKEAPEGGPGEMWLRGPNMTSGYIFNEAATKAAFKDDGWYNTGDVCTFTKEGWLQVVGRTKELIKYKGFQVSPTELEAYINSHPDVEEAAVGGVWDEKQLTELPTAYVVFRSSVRTKDHKVRLLNELRKDMDSKVSGYKKLRGGVWENTTLPRNANTKVLRKQLPDHRTGLHDGMQANERSKL